MPNICHLALYSNSLASDRTRLANLLKIPTSRICRLGGPFVAVTVDAGNPADNAVQIFEDRIERLNQIKNYEWIKGGPAFARQSFRRLDRRTAAAPDPFAPSGPAGCMTDAEARQLKGT